MELPSHPDANDAEPEQKPSTSVRWGKVLVVAVVAAFLAVMVILHLTGVVGPAAR